MGAGLLASRGVKERLEKHEDPIGFIQSLRSKGVKGQLTLDMIPLNPGRVIAPIAEVPLENIDMRNNMPCLLYTSPSPRDVCSSRMPSSA